MIPVSTAPLTKRTRAAFEPKARGTEHRDVRTGLETESSIVNNYSTASDR